jgi:hypothetical protein
MNNTINIDANLSEDLKKISNYNGNSIRDQIVEFLVGKYPELSDYDHDDLEDIKVFSKRGNYILSLPDKIYQILQNLSENKGNEIYNMINDDIEDYVNANSDIIQNYNEEDYEEEYLEEEYYEDYDEDYDNEDYDDEEEYYDDYEDDRY